MTFATVDHHASMPGSALNRRTTSYKFGAGNCMSPEFCCDCASAGAKGTVDAAGVLVSDDGLSCGVVLSVASCADEVGDNAVKGWWNDDDHVLGVPGIYGKG